jgi:hypothetical protein
LVAASELAADDGLAVQPTAASIIAAVPNPIAPIRHVLCLVIAVMLLTPS